MGVVGRGGRVASQPFIVGLTGNIATGKTAAAGILAALGAAVIDADLVAHEVMKPAGPVYDAVVQAFGPAILSSDGDIDRGKLGEVVFRDPLALQRLELIVHPAILSEVARRIEQTTAPVVAIEAIKLIETGMTSQCDALWVVVAPRELQIQRLVATRGLSTEQAALRVDAQPPQEQKMAVADRVILNRGSLAALRLEVEAAWDSIQGA